MPITSKIVLTATVLMFIGRFHMNLQCMGKETRGGGNDDAAGTAGGNRSLDHGRRKAVLREEEAGVTGP
jgi:hypothetical protein